MIGEPSVAPLAGATSEGGCCPHAFVPMLVVTLELSLAGLPSTVDPLTCAVFVIEPEVAVTVYEEMMETLWPTARVPTAQGKGPVQPPPLTMNERPTGVASKTETFVAAPGPVLVMVSV